MSNEQTFKEQTPWTLIHINEDGNRGIESYSFDHDVVLWVTGDFESDEQRDAYCQRLADILNSQAFPVTEHKG